MDKLYKEYQKRLREKLNLNSCSELSPQDYNLYMLQMFVEDYKEGKITQTEVMELTKLTILWLG